MDTLSKEKCQELISADHEWNIVDLTKRSGSILKFKTVDVDVRKDEYPTMLKECVMKYEVGDFCSEHIDSPWYSVHPNYHADVVWITPLNNDYEGGELYFDGNHIEQVVGVPIKYKRKTPHEITEVTKGTRYSLVSWLFIPNKPSKKRDK